MQGALARPQGRLRSVCRGGLGRHFIVPWLAEFLDLYPALSVGIELVEKHLPDLVNSGCDLALTIGHLRDTSLVARRIAETDSHIFASPAYLQARGNPRTPAELAQLDCLTEKRAGGHQPPALS